MREFKCENDCVHYDNCKEPCDVIGAAIPKSRTGALRKEVNYRDNVYYVFPPEKYFHQLTSSEKDALYRELVKLEIKRDKKIALLCYALGMRPREIAAGMRRPRSWVYRTLDWILARGKDLARRS